MEGNVYIVDDRVYIAGSMLWGMCCGWQDVYCGRGALNTVGHIAYTAGACVQGSLLGAGIHETPTLGTNCFVV